VGWSADQKATLGSWLIYQSKDKNAVKAAASNIEVRGLGTRELRDSGASVLLSGEKTAKSVRLLGPALSLTAKKASDGKLLAGPATLRLQIPAKANASQVRIVHASKGGTWTEIKSSIKQHNGRPTATANVQDAGAYALIGVAP
jgi:hypothetical protein